MILVMVQQYFQIDSAEMLMGVSPILTIICNGTRGMCFFSSFSIMQATALIPPSYSRYNLIIQMIHLVQRKLFGINKLQRQQHTQGSVIHPKQQNLFCSCLFLPLCVFWLAPFSRFISFPPCVSSLLLTPPPLPVLSSLLSLCDRSMLYPFGFPLQLYSPGN